MPKLLKKKGFLSFFFWHKRSLAFKTLAGHNHEAEWERIPAAKRRDSNITMVSESRLRDWHFCPLTLSLKVHAYPNSVLVFFMQKYLFSETLIHSSTLPVYRWSVDLFFSPPQRSASSNLIIFCHTRQSCHLNYFNVPNGQWAAYSLRWVLSVMLQLLNLTKGSLFRLRGKPFGECSILGITGIKNASPRCRSQLVCR